MTMGADIAKIDRDQLARDIKAKARQLGFDLVGIAAAHPSEYGDYFRQWVRDGQAGEMTFMETRVDERTDPGKYFPGAVSAICVAMNYYTPLLPEESAGYVQVSVDHRRSRTIVDPVPAPPAHPKSQHETKTAEAAVHRSPPPTESPMGRIARYALGDDYHQLIKDRLHDLADWLRQTAGGLTKSAVDTAPVMEKELAARAGVGWFGKNACVINEKVGSWLLLGEVLTTLDLPADEPAIDRCGTCRRCIDACPTQAIVEPYRIEARKCISYLTIEHEGSIAEDLQRRMGDWIYGCDICQDVCPYNRNPPATDEDALASRFPGGAIDLEALLDWDILQYRATLRGSAMKRVSLPVLQRNARIALENVRRGE
jgi:epoxyqueuosine reductase